MGFVPYQPTLPLPDSAASTTRSRRTKNRAGASASAAGSVRSTGAARGSRPSADRGAAPTTSASSLYGPDEDWRLDEGTRRTGRQGLKCARAVLAELNGHGSDSPGTGRRAAA